MTGLTSAQMQVASNFSGFDFTSTPIWYVPAGAASPSLCTFVNTCIPAIQIYVLPVPGQSSVYGASPSLNYCYSSSISSCVYVAYTGIPSTAQSFSLTGGATTKNENISGGVTGSLALTGNPSISSGLSNLSAAGTYALTLTPTLTLAGYTFNAGNAIDFTINKAPLTISGSSVASKVYDGGTTAVVTAGTLSGFVGTETVTVSAATGAFGSKDVGTYSINTTYSLANGSNGGLASNYSLASETLSASITPKALTISGTSVASKVYDGGTTAVVTAGTLSGFVGTETVTVSAATGAFGSKDVGTHNINTTYTLANGSNGGLASNYSLASETLSASITPKALTISGSSIANKAYDGTVTAVVTAGNLLGLVGSETLTISGAGVFGSKDVGTYSINTAYTLANGSNGGLASNYSLASETLGASITPKALTISNSSIANKVYDGTTTAVVTAGSLVGLVGTETLTVTGTGAFGSKDVGAYNISTAYTLGNGNNGGLASNYSLASETLSASITPKALTITGSSVASKTYDGTVTAVVTAGTLSGFVGSETVTVSAATGAFGSKDVGTYSISTAYTLADGSNGGLASNYSLANQNLSASITPKALTITGSSVASKVYDGTVTAVVTAGTLSGFVGSETVTVSGAGVFGAKDVGTHSINTTYTLGNGSGGGLGSNYSLASETLSASITPATLQVVAEDATKVQDNQPFAGGNGVRFNGFVNNENSAVLGGTLAYGGSAQGAVNPGS